MHEPSRIEDPSFFRSLSSLLSASVIVPWLSSLTDARTLWLKFESPFIPWSSSCSMRTVSCFWYLRLLPSSHLLPHHLSYHLTVPAAWQLLLPWCRGQIPCVLPLRTLAPRPRTTPPQVLSPNDHFTTEAYVEYTEESLGEQQIPDDFDYDDLTIGQTLFHACWRRADHSEEEGLLSCLSSSVSHDRAVNLVVCRLMSSAHETQRHNSENKQIRTLLHRQREQILVDRQAKIRKHEFQADETIESQKEEICRAYQRRRMTPTRSTTSSWTEKEAKIGISLKLMRKVSMKWKNWSDFKVQHSTRLQREIGRRTRYYPWTHWQEYRNCKIKLIVWVIQEIFKMLNQYAMDNPTLLLNLCFSHLVQFLVECQAVL